MSRVLITGSSDGLGLMAARLLVADGHSVTLHARNQARADDTKAALVSTDGVIVGDLSSIAGMRQIARQANAPGGSTRSSTTPESAIGRLGGSKPTTG